jgi:Alpha/beta hydrolase domain
VAVTDQSGGSVFLHRSSRSIRAVTLVASALLLGLAACSSSKSASPPSTTAASNSTSAPAQTTTTIARPSGPAATLTPLGGGGASYLGESASPDLAKLGYTTHEFAAAGTATSYKVDGARTHDGGWKLVTATNAAYRTRVLVRQPADPSKFSGNVLVEWLNVSGGIDANPEWVSLQDEIVRAGDAWVGVSAQRIGVEGGPVLVSVKGVPGADQAGKGLKKIDPARYGTLEHPGDAFSYDIFTQVARALRTGAGLSGLQPEHLIAGGESQSAFALVSYYDGVQPLTRAFDGFFVHSRSAVGLPLDIAPGGEAGIQDALSGTAALFRTDQDAPVMDIQTETDVASILDSYAARQPDNAHFRLWEVTGTAHADAHLLGPSAKYINCGVPINDGDMHIVAKAAWRALTVWVAKGTPPRTAPRIDVTAGPTPTVQRDADGIALGGIRTPPVDVPVAAVSGVPGPNPSTICLLLGSAKPLSAARLAKLYLSRSAYLQKFTADADATIKAGFALAEDRTTLLAFAEPQRIAG